MSAASYLQMTDLVTFCKEYIHSSLEICNKERERKKENQAQDGTAGPDSGTASADISSGAEAVEAHSQAADEERRSALHSESETSGRTVPVPATTTPCKSQNTDSHCPSKKELDSGDGGQEQHMDRTNHASPSPALTPELVNPKIEYDPDEELIQSPDNKDLALYPAQALNHSIHSRHPPSSPPSNERTPPGYSPSFHSARQLMEAVSRSEGPSFLMDRLGHRINHGLINSAGGRLDESAGFVGSSMLEIQSDWLGEDAGN